MTKKIGIIGNTGRIGRLLSQLINEHKKNQQEQFELGLCFNKAVASKITLADLFRENDYVVDFSSASLTGEILDAANTTLSSCNHFKGLVICSTGLDKASIEDSVTQLSSQIPLVIAHNTSTGSTTQYFLTSLISKLLTTEYDIDIIEKHHRNKIDSPSGTALNLIEAIKTIKQQTQKLQYFAHDFINPINTNNYHRKSGSVGCNNNNPRPKNVIGISVQRSGNIAGEHEVTFTSDDEMISIKHTVFNRRLFAIGAMKIIYWLDSTSPAPGLYTMQDVIGL